MLVNAYLNAYLNAYVGSSEAAVTPSSVGAESRQARRISFSRPVAKNGVQACSGGPPSLSLSVLVL